MNNKLHINIILKILPNYETDLSLLKHNIEKLFFVENEKGKWYIKSHDKDGKEKLVLNENTGKSAPEEIVRQLFLYDLTDTYGYPINRIAIEQPIKYGSSKDERGRADVVVYQEDNVTPWILTEVKAPNQKNNIQQLKGYLNTEGSPLGVGVNGKTITRLLRPYPKEFDSTLPDLPFESEFQQVKDETQPASSIKDVILNRKWTLDELNQLNENKLINLREIIDKLEELVLANSGYDDFTEIFKLIYAKLYDEEEAKNRKGKVLKFRQYKTPKVTYDEISKLFEEAKKEWKGVFDASDFIKLTPEHLDVCIGELTEIKLFFSNLRIIDEAFEYLISSIAKGNKGQYFTPRVVIDFCVRMLNPKRKEYIMDPACGSAGFLVHTMEHIWDKYGMKDQSSRTRYASKYLWGIDFDEKTAKISRAIMLIAGDGKTHIYRENSLEYTRWSPKLVNDLKSEELIKGKNNKELLFDLIMTNPPFAGDVPEKQIINLYNDILGCRYSYKLDISKIKVIVSTLTNDNKLEFSNEGIKNILNKVKDINKNDEIDLELDEDKQIACEEIAQTIIDNTLEGSINQSNLIPKIKEPLNFRKNESKFDRVDRHILFIQRVIDLLKEGGRAVIVLPQGIFNNSNEKYVRKYVTDKARILAVIGLHVNSFKPHTGTKTSLLFLRKYTENEERKNYPIFFATSKISFKDNSGEYLFLRDDNGKPVFDDSKNQVYLTDLYMIAEAFEKWALDKLNKGDSAFNFVGES